MGSQYRDPTLITKANLYLEHFTLTGPLFKLSILTVLRSISLLNFKICYFSSFIEFAVIIFIVHFAVYTVSFFPNSDGFH